MVGAVRTAHVRKRRWWLPVCHLVVAASGVETVTASCCRAPRTSGAAEVGIAHVLVCLTSCSQRWSYDRVSGGHRMMSCTSEAYSGDREVMMFLCSYTLGTKLRLYMGEPDLWIGWPEQGELEVLETRPGASESRDMAKVSRRGYQLWTDHLRAILITIHTHIFLEYHVLGEHSRLR